MGNEMKLEEALRESAERRRRAADGAARTLEADEHLSAANVLDAMADTVASDNESVKAALTLARDALRLLLRQEVGYWRGVAATARRREAASRQKTTELRRRSRSQYVRTIRALFQVVSSGTAREWELDALHAGQVADAIETLLAPETEQQDREALS